MTEKVDQLNSKIISQQKKKKQLKENILQMEGDDVENQELKNRIMMELKEISEIKGHLAHIKKFNKEMKTQKKKENVEVIDQIKVIQNLEREIYYEKKKYREANETVKELEILNKFDFKKLNQVKDNKNKL